MRRTIVVLAGVLMVSGCTGGPQRLDGEAAPAGAVPKSPAAPVVSTTPSAVPSSTSSSSSSSPSPSVVTSTTSSRTTAADSTPTRFSRNGLGGLEIGMRRQEALDTGMVENWSGDDRCSTFELVPANSDGVAVVYSRRYGVVGIPGYGSVSTPEGIRTGSTLTELRVAYPGLEEMLDLGKAFAQRTDRDGAYYEFILDDATKKVDYLAVVADESDC